MAGLLDNITEPRLKAADGEIEMNGLQRSIRVRYGGTTCTVLPTISSNYASCNPTKNIHNGVAASFFPAQVSSAHLARVVEFSIFAEAERLV